MSTVEAEVGASRTQVNQRSEHILYVEGKDGGIDNVVLETLFYGTALDLVRPLGSSRSIRAVAKSLHRHHPKSYFLIDRDTLDDKVVNSLWENFPDPSTHNTLCWKKREIESYFLEPSFFCSSSFVSATEKEVEQELLRLAKDRIWHDIARFSAQLLCGQDLSWWHGKQCKFSFKKDRNSALDELMKCSLFEERREGMEAQYSSANCEAIFKEVENRFLAGSNSPQFGLGQWLALMEASELLAELINKFALVKVETASGVFSPLHGEDALIAFVRDILSNAIATKTVPQDFIDVTDLIMTKVTSNT